MSIIKIEKGIDDLSIKIKECFIESNEDGTWIYLTLQEAKDLGYELIKVVESNE